MWMNDFEKVWLVRRGEKMETFIDRTCIKCGASFKVRPSQLKHHRGICCSHSCAASLSSINRNQTGSFNNNWKGGVTSASRKRKYAAAHPERAQAHKTLTNALRRGQIKKLPCEVCGLDKTEGHHPDYKNPLAVRWLCKQHHLEAHHGCF